MDKDRKLSFEFTTEVLVKMFLKKEKKKTKILSKIYTVVKMMKQSISIDVFNV